jgi:hypothetical protein
MLLLPEITRLLALLKLCYCGTLIALYINEIIWERGISMRIIGLPISSFIYEIVVPALLVVYMFFYCHQVKKGKIE